jgi:hypothetical protein
MAYLTVEELKSNPGVTDTIKGTEVEQEVRLQFLLDYCSLLIDSYTQTSFTKSENEIIYIDGTGDNEIRLPKKIYNIKDVRTYDDSLVYSLTDLLIVGNGRTIFSRTTDFQEGEYNIKITGDFGWATVPQDIINCLILLCNGNFCILDDEEVLTKIAGPFKSEKIGNYSYEIKQRLNTVTGETIDSTGDVKVDQILDKYRISRLDIGVI